MNKIFGFLSYYTFYGVLIAVLAACNTTPDNNALCPQPRDTEFAPAPVAAMTNPLPHDENNLHAGEQLFHDALKPAGCVTCHGNRGDGKGILASQFRVPPRDFTCAPTMHSIPDGQLYWIIKNGSAETNMPAFNKLKDEQVWQLVMYIRELAPMPLESQTLSSK